MGCCFYFWVHNTDFFVQFFTGIPTIFQKLSDDVFIDFKDVWRIVIIEIPYISHLIIDINADSSYDHIFGSISFVHLFSILFAFLFQLFIIDVLEFAFKQHGRAVENIDNFGSNILFKYLVSIEGWLQNFLGNFMIEFLKVVNMLMIVGNGAILNFNNAFAKSILYFTWFPKVYVALFVQKVQISQVLRR